jgi:hypothetical protein
MKKLIVSCMALLLMCTAVMAAPKDVEGFLKTKWGMTRRQVEATHKGRPTINDPEALQYDAKLVNLDCAMVYLFVENKLCRAGYLVPIEVDSAIGYFQMIKDLLIKKYGKPYSDEIFWKDDFSKDYLSPSVALMSGSVKYRCVWRFPTTNIFLCLPISNSEMAIFVGYESVTLKPQAEKYQDEREMTNL